MAPIAKSPVEQLQGRGAPSHSMAPQTPVVLIMLTGVLLAGAGPGVWFLGLESGSLGWAWSLVPGAGPGVWFLGLGPRAKFEG
jgi:hypothetical protein